ncbi:membrane protein [Caballeronia mineralivorans PML1(12)]|uniref:Membrane protein n=1 Tax=Caballeronia mineralivorans PML1(12) TaxID=908627 RepID=A0A0J1D273_9BURK|nr:DUF485 domain-containing protein [Caballeronia mineralivorans]KLU26837.1 membrane protein [Caballeronia mineralivorans PML1(12)]
MQSDQVDWLAMQKSEQFRGLVRHRRNTIAALGLVAALYYFSIPALIAWFPAFFTLRLAPGINLGLVFAVSQYPFGGLIAYVFLRRTASIDRLAADLLEQLAPASAANSVAPVASSFDLGEHAHAR